MRIENSFIPVEGVGETTERRIWREGVTTWESFDPAVDVAGVGSTACRPDRVVHRRGADAPRRRRLRLLRPHLPQRGALAALRELPRGDPFFFDIETTGLDEHRDRVTTVSFHRDGETTTLVAGEDLTAERLREQFADASLLATFNGARFDVPFLETAFDIEIDTPHLDLMYPCKRIGLSGGLKPIEKEIGIERDRPDLSGRDAVRLSGASTNARRRRRARYLGLVQPRGHEEPPDPRRHRHRDAPRGRVRRRNC